MPDPGTIGILRGIQNALLLRREGRVAEANRELQMARFELQEKQFAAQEERHKESMELQRMENKMRQYGTTPQGIRYNKATGAMLEDITGSWLGKMVQSGQMSQEDAARINQTRWGLKEPSELEKARAAQIGQEMQITSAETGRTLEAQNILKDPASTPEDRKYANAILKRPLQRPTTLGAGQAMYDQTGRLIAERPPTPPRTPDKIVEFNALQEMTQEERDQFFTFQDRMRTPTTPTTRQRDFEYYQTLDEEGKEMYDALYGGADVKLQSRLEWYRKEGYIDEQQVKDAVQIKLGLAPSEGTKSIAQKKAEFLEKRLGRKLTDEEILGLVGSRTSTGAFLNIGTALDQLSYTLITITGKDELAKAEKEIKKRPEKYRKQFIESVHIIVAALPENLRAVFYDYASNILGKKIQPRIVTAPTPGIPTEEKALTFKDLTDEEADWWIKINEAAQKATTAKQANDRDESKKWVDEYNRLLKNPPSDRVIGLFERK